jgi:tungstate transport system substrate-binding protein
MLKRTLYVVTLLVVLAGLLAGCGATPTAAPTEPAQATVAPTAAATEQAQAAAAPTAKPEPTSPRTGAGANDLILATTTSTYDSGLLDSILPDFQKQCNCQVKVVAVGSGQAMAIGALGDADVLLVHSRKAEDKFVADGNAKERFDVMYNDFVIVGPPEDPAKINGMATAKEAFTAIAAAKAPFVSRGDSSGTNTKEMSIWASAEISPTQQVDWYNSIGQGMADALQFANEKGAYTLTDRGTWLSMADNLPGLTILVGGNTLDENKDKVLYNPYGVMAVNPDKFPGVKADLAQQFVDWILSVPTQLLIKDYGVDKWGQPLFYPNSQQYVDSLSAAPVTLKITGIPTEVSLTEDQLKAMPTLDVDYTGKDGTTTTYTGVLLTDVLKKAGVTGAPDLTLLASDGFSYDLASADYVNCTDCIVAFDPEGGLRSVLPALGGKAQVKNLVEIQVKGSAAPAEGGIPADAALKVTGNVATPIGWTEEAVKAMDTIDVQSTNKQGETQTYTGVLLKDLVALAGPAADATTVVFVASDGYTAEMPLADLMACTNCIASFRSQGGFSTVMPDQPGSLQVKGVVEIQVK